MHSNGYGVPQNDAEAVKWWRKGAEQGNADAQSNLGIVGRYIFTPAIFDYLEQATTGALGEIQLTDSMALLAQHQTLLACRLHGTRYDVGTPLGLLQAAVELAMQRPDLKPAVVQWLKRLQLN